MGLSEPKSETVGERLRRLRQERGLSQRALASKGVSYAYISRIEAGSRTPSVKALRVLAKQLGVSVEYLETGTDLAVSEGRELRLREAELELRLTGDADAAERSLRALVAEAESAGDRVLALRARGALGLAAQRRGDNAQAIAELEPVLAEGTASVVDAWSLYSTLGRAYAAAGRPNDAVALFQQCLEEVEHVAPDNDIAYVRAAALLSAALSDAGDLPAARETVAAALRRAESTGDPLTRVRLYWSYARIALNEQQPRVALENLRRAVALLEATEDTRELGRAHLFWAEILTTDNRAGEAKEHLVLAERLLQPAPDREDLALLRTEQARAAAETGEVEEALARAQEALSLTGKGDQTERATALWALGHAQVLAGEVHAGIETLGEALAGFERQREWFRATSVARLLGQVLRRENREAEAMDVLERAVELSSRADAARRPSPLRS